MSMKVSLIDHNDTEWERMIAITYEGKSYLVKVSLMNKCKECEGELYPLDTEDHECKCGAMYCGNCNAEFSKEGELLSYGRVML
jgi:hypothetical protein